MIKFMVEKQFFRYTNLKQWNYFCNYFSGKLFCCNKSVTKGMVYYLDTFVNGLLTLKDTNKKLC